MLSKTRYRHHLIFLSLVLLGGSLMYCQQTDKAISKEFVVQRLYASRSAKDTAQIVINWTDISSLFSGAEQAGFIVKDLNFGKTFEAKVVDTDGDKVPEQLVFDYVFASNEPIFAFTLSSSEGNALYVSEKASTNERLKITWLKSYTDYIKDNPVDCWSDKIIESTLQLYPNAVDFPIYAPNRWNYEYGFFLNATFVRWQETKNEKYLDYIKQWVNRFIDENGKLDSIQYRPDEYKLDDILPGRLLLSLYELTKEEKYKNAANQLKAQLLTQPKTSEGGYWHKQVYPSQMWLDGIYMADVFSLQYAQTFNEPALVEEAIHQIKLISKYTTDSTTGLMYHGWDESKNKVWADSVKGTSPEFWGRAVGWYMMALVESIEYIPVNHPERETLIKLFQDLSASVKKYQDTNNHLWYQVMDKGNQEGNWIETSCSAMFTYAFAKGNRLGLLDDEYLKAAQEAYQSLLKDYIVFDDQGILYLNRTVKIGTLNPKGSKGDFDYYISTECRINDYKGLAALLYASLELDKVKNN